jgi:O-antigen/teichoic acid export membrane protein
VKIEAVHHTNFKRRLVMMGGGKCIEQRPAGFRAPMTFTTIIENRVPVRLQRLAQPLALMAMRMANTAAKFLLTIYTARYLGLAELGIFGLLIGATTILPAVLGLGTTDWVMRHIVSMPRDEALASIATRLALPTLLHMIIQPVLWLANDLLGGPVPWPLLLAGGLVLFLDHVASDACDLLIGRGRILLTNILLFMRAGLWPPVFIVLAAFDPSARTLLALLLCWLGAELLVWLVLAAHLLARERWRAVGIRLPWIISGVRASVPFYIKDLTGSASLYLDRFVLSLFLNLELVGAYTLFWSIANVLQNLTVYSVIQPKLRGLIQSAQQTDQTPFRALERKLQIEGAIWIACLAVVASVVIVFLVPLLNRPLLQDNLYVFWIILGATALRAGADSYGFAMLALRKDRAIALASVSGAVASVVLNLALIPTLGLAGAAIAYLVTSGGLLLLRYRITRTSA